jgi:hypothetical protein
MFALAGNQPKLTPQFSTPRTHNKPAQEVLSVVQHARRQYVSRGSLKADVIVIDCPDLRHLSYGAKVVYVRQLLFIRLLTWLLQHPMILGEMLLNCTSHNESYLGRHARLQFTWQLGASIMGLEAVLREPGASKLPSVPELRHKPWLQYLLDRIAEGNLDSATSIPRDLLVSLIQGYWFHFPPPAKGLRIYLVPFPHPDSKIRQCQCSMCSRLCKRTKWLLEQVPITTSSIPIEHRAMANRHLLETDSRKHRHRKAAEEVRDQGDQSNVSQSGYRSELLSHSQQGLIGMQRSTGPHMEQTSDKSSGEQGPVRSCSNVTGKCKTFSIIEPSEDNLEVPPGYTKFVISLDRIEYSVLRSFFVKYGGKYGRLDPACLTCQVRYNSHLQRQTWKIANGPFWKVICTDHH